MANKEESGIYFEYFKISKEYQDKYGKHTVLLMQVGSFFEINGLKDIANQRSSTILPIHGIGKENDIQK